MEGSRVAGSGGLEGTRGRGEEGVRPLCKTSGLGSPTVLFLRSGKFVYRGDRARSDENISRSFVAARVVLDSHRAARRRSLLPHCRSLGLFLCSPLYACVRVRTRMCVRALRCARVAPCKRFVHRANGSFPLLDRGACSCTGCSDRAYRCAVKDSPLSSRDTLYVKGTLA